MASVVPDLCGHAGVVTCVFVVGGGLGLLRAAALLQEEGGSFDHEEALAEAGNHNVFILQCIFNNNSLFKFGE